MKRIVLFFAVLLCFAACKQTPETNDDYPAANLPPIDSAAAKGSAVPEIPRGLHGQVIPEADETGGDAALPDEGSSAETPAGPGSSPREPGRSSSVPVWRNPPAEIFLPESVTAEAEPAAEIALHLPAAPVLPEPAVPPELPPVQAGRVPPPAEPSARPVPAAPAEPAVPPAVRAPASPPEFVRPSEPVAAEESPREAPVVRIPDLPASSPIPVDAPVYSRTVTAFVGQYIDIPFRGPGWVYLGELGSRRGVYYDSRRIDSEGMIFVFRADEAGSYSLKFNRQDFVRDYVINDYVRVTVLEPPEITGSVWHSTAVAPDRVYAEPRWPPAEGVPSGGLNPAAAQTGQASPDQAAAAQAGQAAVDQAAAAQTGQAAPDQAAAAQTGQAAVDQAAAAQAGQAAVDQPAAAQTGQAAPDQAAATQTGQAAVLPAGSAPDVYLGRAKEEYDAGRIAGVLEALDQFRTAYPAGSDEAYWLYGQALEAAGPNRDIRLALDYYRRLVREYPQSFRYDAAARRIAYLERFYFNIQ